MKRLAIAVFALLIAVGAWVAGPSSAATRLRSWWHRTVGRSGTSADEAVPVGAVAMFVARYTPALRGVGVAIAFVVLIAWTNPTALTILVIGLVLLVYLAVVEFLGRTAKTQPTVGAPR